MIQHDSNTVVEKTVARLALENTTLEMSLRSRKAAFDTVCSRLETREAEIMRITREKNDIEGKLDLCRAELKEKDKQIAALKTQLQKEKQRRR